MSDFYTIDSSQFTFIEHLGIDLELILRKANIPYRQAIQEGISMDMEQYISYMESLDVYVSDSSIIDSGNIDNVLSFNPPLFAAMCAKNGEDCYKIISKYKKLIGPFVLKVTSDEDSLSLEFVFDDNRTPIPRYTALMEQVLMVGILRKATGLRIVPTKVASIHDYGDGTLKDYFGIEPEKSVMNVLTFRKKDVLEPFITKNNVMWSYLEPELIKRVRDMETDDTFSAKVRSALFELIPTGRDNVEDVAKEFSMSARTLQRKLSGEDTTFIKQLNHTRELLARNYLKDRKISSDEIAFLVGYSDANAFSRAFRGWTGMTVGEYRRRYS